MEKREALEKPEEENGNRGDNRAVAGKKGAAEKMASMLKGGEEAGQKGKRGSFLRTTLLFYLMMLLLYLYFMLANLSMAPKFVYTQF